ncbi:MAG: site-2 protease family protein [Gloeomargaritaceae cyanobacterium C42_A2020_066]|nr:site-2 protease family protein [Gloeomargaritaceae cyanobacterium C42_A2020_066]
MLTTWFVALAAVALLGWTLYRSLPLGKLGLLAWFQSVTLMLPWLLFFGLVSLGIYPNFVLILLLFIGSTVLYIAIGQRLRSAGRALAAVQQTAPAEDSSPTSDALGAAAPVTEESQAASNELTMPAADLQALQGVFGIDTFFATETIPYQGGAIVKGNLRGEPALVRQGLAERLQASLGERYTLFLVAGTDGRPTVIVLPTERLRLPSAPTQRLFMAGLLVTTVFTCFQAAGLALGLEVTAIPGRWGTVLPLALGTLAVLGVHELGHWWMARQRGVKLQFPFFLPAWQVGSFGAITRFREPVPHRAALFDVAAAGPLAGGGLALVLLVLGLYLSRGGGGLPVLPQILQGSVLVGTLARVILGAELQEVQVGLHPLVISGWVGLVITSLNLMPAGALDGGRIVQSIYGRPTANRLTVVTLVVLALVALGNPLSLYWGILIFFLQREPERPTLEDITEPDDTRAGLGLLLLFLMLATLIPLSPSLAGRLGIGG